MALRPTRNAPAQPDARRPPATATNPVFRVGSETAADPEHLARHTSRAELDDALTDLLRFELDRQTRDVFTEWDRRFLADMRQLVAAQDELTPTPPHPRPLTGRQLVVVFKVLGKVSALVAKQMQTMKLPGDGQ